MKQHEFDEKLCKLIDMAPDSPEIEKLKEELKGSARENPDLGSEPGRPKDVEDIDQMIDVFAQASPSAVTQEEIGRYHEWLRENLPEQH